MAVKTYNPQPPQAAVAWCLWDFDSITTKKAAQKSLRLLKEVPPVAITKGELPPRRGGGARRYYRNINF